jgi:hypothetical protein
MYGALGFVALSRQTRAYARRTGARKADIAASHELRLNYVVLALAYAHMMKDAPSAGAARLNAPAGRYD